MTASETNTTVDTDRTLAAARKRIDAGRAMRERGDEKLKWATVDAVRILVDRRFPTASSVEFHKEYNEDAFTLHRANDEDGDEFWAVYDQHSQRSDTSKQRYDQITINSLMANLGADAGKYLPRIDDLIGETVVFRFDR